MKDRACPPSVLPDISRLFVNENAGVGVLSVWVSRAETAFALAAEHSFCLDLLVTRALWVEVELKALLARRVCSCLEAELMA